FFYGMYRVVRTLIWGADIPGYESLIVTILFLGGIQLLALGVIGDYLGRVFAEVKGRPLFIVRAAYGWEPEEEEARAASERPRRDPPGA
ncbi:MAG: glycosyltransferase, partial [Rhodospirillaceae bacterium]